jgi:adenine-specific DNA-methyltransferase
VANKPNALVVDFFAGSGTTLHAVNLLNAEDGGNRRCVMVTNNEVSEEELGEYMLGLKEMTDKQMEGLL